VRRVTGPAALEKVEAILRNPAIFAMAELIPESTDVGGRPRTYPNFMVFVYGSLCSVWRSARQVEAELAQPLVWTFMRDLVAARFPDDPSRHLPAAPMRRHHFIYMRNRYLTDPAILEAIGNLHRSIATEQARATGLLKADGAGSWTHPSLDRLLHADGKVVTPLFRANPETHVSTSRRGRSSRSDTSPTRPCTSKVMVRQHGARSSSWSLPVARTKERV
jgi:hypothetical protein